MHDFKEQLDRVRELLKKADAYVCNVEDGDYEIVIELFEAPDGVVDAGGTEALVLLHTRSLLREAEDILMHQLQKRCLRDVWEESPDGK